MGQKGGRLVFVRRYQDFIVLGILDIFVVVLFGAGFLYQSMFS